MKMFATVEITKGWETWNKMAEEMNSEMESEGMEFIFKGCDMEEKKLHLIIEVESMEKAKEFSTRPHIVSRRVEAGAVVESTVMIPLKN